MSSTDGPRAIITVRPNAENPDEITITADNHHMNQAVIALALRRTARRFDALATADGLDPFPDDQQEPTALRWGLDDIEYGDTGTTTILLSDHDGHPYWLELEPERTAALREVLAGPDGAAELEQLRIDAGRFRDDYLTACRTIAAMHEAATGRTGQGPVRGVVEDVADVRTELEESRTRIGTLHAERERLRARVTELEQQAVTARAAITAAAYRQAAADIDAEAAR